MNSLTTMRITVGSLAALLTGAVAYGVHANDETSALRTQTQRAASVAPTDPDDSVAQQLVVPRDDDWDDEDGESDGEYDSDDDDGWRIVVPDQSGGAVQPAPAQAPRSQAS